MRVPIAGNAHEANTTKAQDDMRLGKNKPCWRDSLKAKIPIMNNGIQPQKTNHTGLSHICQMNTV
jgi:hypothetical protein